MPSITIKETGLEYNLIDPTFNVIGKAMGKIASSPDNLFEAGKLIFDACYLQNNEKLSDLQENKNAKLYATLCLNAAGLLDLYEAELKKN